MEYAYVAQVASAGLAATVKMNDCTVFHTRVDAPRSEQYDLSPWVLAVPEAERRPTTLGLDNRLEVHLAELDPATEREGPPHFRLQLHKRDPGRDLSLLTVMAGFRWTAAELQLTGTAPLEAFSHTWLVRHEDSYGRWSWQDAEPFTDDDRAPIAELLQRAHQALATRSISRLHSLFEPRYADLAHASGRTAAELREEQEAFLTPYFDARDWRMRPLDPSSLTYQPDAGGRLVQVYDASGGPPLAGAGGGATCVHGVGVAKLDGAWHIVR